MKAKIKETWKFRPMWQTKYAAAIPKNLGVGVNFRPCSAVKAVSSLGVRSPWYGGSIHALRMYLLNFVERDFCLQLWLKPTRQIWHNSISTNYKWWQLWAIFSKPLWSYNALVFLLLKFHRIFLKNIYCLHACILWILFEIVNEWQKNWASSNSTSQSF